MIKVTEDGIEVGKPVKLTKEDLEFINEMFNDFSEYEKHPWIFNSVLDRCDD